MNVTASTGSVKGRIEGSAFANSRGGIILLGEGAQKQHPHEVEVNYRNQEELMQEYLEIARQLETAQNTLKAELMAALEGAQ